jgi:zinc transport system permease protein
MDFFTEPLAYEFMQRALMAGVAVGAVCAAIGVFVVQRGLSFLGDGLAHAAFGGIAIGLWLGTSVENALWLAIPFTVAIALGIGVVLRKSQLRGDVATGVFFAFSFALGVVFLKLRPATAPAVNVESILFGNITLVTSSVLRVVVVVSIVALALVLALWRKLAYAIFDPELAVLSGVPVAALEYMLLALTAVVIVVAVKTVGVVLVSSFIVIPAATARLVGTTLARVTAGAIGIGTVCSFVGLLLSYNLKVPSGATIILTLSACFGAALVYHRVAHH